MVDKTGVKVFTAQVSVTGSGLDLEDTLLNGHKRHTKGSSSDRTLHLPWTFLSRPYAMVAAVGPLMTEDVDASNRTGILGCGTLGVIEVVESW